MIDIHPFRELGLWLWFLLGFCSVCFAFWLAAPSAGELNPPTPSAIESTPANISRAQYLTARGSRSAAWGEFSILLVRNDGEHQLIVGMTGPECAALRKELESEKSARGSENKLYAGLRRVIRAKENNTPCKISDRECFLATQSLWRLLLWGLR